jgi:hypothetical protein
VTLTANQIRQELFMRINQAQVHHDLLVALRDCTTTQENLVRFNRNVRFFSGVESALFNSAIVLLYSLYERREDTVNFYQLLEQLRPVAPPEEIDAYLAKVRAIKPTWVRVGILRNELVGHQTMLRTRSAAETKAGLRFSDVDALLAHSKELLSHISSRLFDTSLEYMEDSQGAVGELFSRVAL